MKPKPFWPLNHFTVPCIMCLFFQNECTIAKQWRSAADWRILGRSSVRRAVRGRGQVVRPKLDEPVYAFECKTASAISGQRVPRVFYFFFVLSIFATLAFAASLANRSAR